MPRDPSSAPPIGHEASLPPDLLARVARLTVAAVNRETVPLRRTATERFAIGVLLLSIGILIGAAAVSTAFLLGLWSAGS